VSPKKTTPKVSPADFEHLLMTWPIMSDVFGEALRLSASTGRSPEAIAASYEASHGRGHYEERKQFLKDTLARLQAQRRPPDLAAVFAALEKARLEWSHAMFGGRQIDDHRRFVQERDRIMRNFQRWARRLHRFLVDRTAPRTAPSGTTLALELLQDRVAHDVLLNFRHEGPVRRPKRGHQAAQWLQDARRDLTAAGVRKDLQEDLLMAVGLTPYRNK
jgi:hypothetical protein